MIRLLFCVCYVRLPSEMGVRLAYHIVDDAECASSRKHIVCYVHTLHVWNNVGTVMLTRVVNICAINPHTFIGPASTYRCRLHTSRHHRHTSHDLFRQFCTAERRLRFLRRYVHMVLVNCTIWGDGHNGYLRSCARYTRGAAETKRQLHFIILPSRVKYKTICAICVTLDK